MNYYDILLAKKLEDDRDPQVVGLSVTENGTYAEEGKVYKPVVVNVPLGSKSITANGTYNATSDNLKGFSSVDVHVSGYKISEVSGLPSAIATFSGASALPMPSLKVSIEPQQSGSGDPSPTNIRPISGWSAVDVTVSPLNISQLYNGQIYGDGSWVSSNMRLTNAVEAQDNSYFLKAGTYTLDYDKLNSNAPNLLQCSALTKDGNYTIIDNFANEWNSVPFTFTLTQDGYFYFTIRKDADTNINPSDYRAKILGHTTTIPFLDSQGNPIEVYGGECDVVNGGGNAYKEYDSYNGETLIGPWISDRDAYVPNTSPTTGAQVVDMGDTSTFYTQPTAIKSLNGQNNLSADCGDVVEASYFEEL